jgi:hypothetical protein
MEVCNPFYVLATSPLKKLDRRLGELQSRCECGGEEKKLGNVHI